MRQSGSGGTVGRRGAAVLSVAGAAFGDIKVYFSAAGVSLGGIDPAAVWQVPGAVAPRCFVQQAVVTFSDIGIT